MQGHASKKWDEEDWGLQSISLSKFVQGHASKKWDEEDWGPEESVAREEKGTADSCRV